MRVLWLSNRIFESTPEKQSGTWLKSLAIELIKDGNITLANISIAKVKKITRIDHENIVQWAVPALPLKGNGLPDSGVVQELQNIVHVFKPDIIHVWGTEGYWGLLTARRLLPGKHILSIQGVLASIQRVFYGGLSSSELLSCTGLREILFAKGSFLFARKNFRKRVCNEEEIVRNHRYIVTQSNWAKGQIEAINSRFLSFSTDRTLREQFISCPPWNSDDNTLSPVLFTSCAGRPYKGIHVLIRATAVLKKRFPSILLNISGTHIATALKMNGYDKWLRRTVSKLGLSDNVRWLGMLNATDIIQRLHNCQVFISPSYVESYSVSLAEALYLGVPSVVSYAGAMPELAVDNQSALFFSPGDHVMCAAKIALLLENPQLASKISREARNAAILRNDPARIVANQKGIYEKVVNDI